MSIDIYVEKIINNINKLDSISFEKHAMRWFESIIELIENTQNLVTFMEKLPDIDIYSEYIASLSNIAKSMLEAMENKDYVHVGDIIAYDLTEVITAMNE